MDIKTGAQKVFLRFLCSLSLQWSIGAWNFLCKLKENGQNGCVCRHTSDRKSFIRLQFQQQLWRARIGKIALLVKKESLTVDYDNFDFCGLYSGFLVGTESKQQLLARARTQTKKTHWLDVALCWAIPITLQPGVWQKIWWRKCINLACINLDYEVIY